jgi:hypothetical protein
MSKKSQPKSKGLMLLTDVLPYELPIYFTNERLFNYANNSTKKSTLVDSLFRQSEQALLQPYGFRINKVDGRSRRLSLMHPAAQIHYCDFYQKYDRYICQLCTRSNYSLRHPYRMASKFYDSRYVDDKRVDASLAELHETGFIAETKFATTYFSYRRYNQIYRFFDSSEFVRLEQESACLLRLDISKCFESIYTHSIAWAVRGKDFSKSNKGSSFFESDFDNVTQSANWRETNGILVGPETSRIFAEIILQAADVAIEKRMNSGISIRRYVDDYFVFAKDRSSLDMAETIIREELEKYNLHLNDSKRDITDRPFASSLTIARRTVNRIISDVMKQVRLELWVFADKSAQLSRSRRFDRLVHRTMADIRSETKRASVSYATLASPSLAVIARSLNTINLRMSSAEEAGDGVDVQDQLSSILKLAEFLFLMDIRASTSNKMARILMELDDVAKKMGSPRRALEAHMLDVTARSIRESGRRSQPIADVINLAIAADYICRDSEGLPVNEVYALLGIEDARYIPSTWGYLEFTAALYFCRRRRELKGLRKTVIQALSDKLCAAGRGVRASGELAMLVVDFLSCPYISDASKTSLFIAASQHCLNSSPSQAEAESGWRALAREHGFVSWQGASSLRQLLAKKELRPAYE